MKQGIVRRVVAASSAAAMAGSVLVMGGTGIASAAPVSSYYEVSGTGFPTWISSFGITRAVSDGSPTFGETVSVTTEVERLTHGYLLYEVQDFTPACMEYVQGSASANKGGTVSADGDRVRWSYGAGRVADTFVLTADYKVTCDAGEVATGGTWMKRAPAGNSELGDRNMGPSINVKRKGTSVLLDQPVNPEVGQSITLSATTINVPEGGRVSFSVDGQVIGEAQVSNGQVSLPWTPTSEGTKLVRATFAQTGTHGGSESRERNVVVSPTNVNSSVSVAAAGTPKVGQSTQLTATVDPAGAGGTVVFSEKGSIIGSAPVSADGTASVKWIPAMAGQRTIDADFSGRSGVNPSSGAAAVTVAAADPSDIATTTTLDAVPVTPLGDEVTLKATVDPSMAGGTVTFYDGQTEIGTADVQSDGTATLAWTPATDGERTILAVFSGEDNYLSSQGTTQAIITPAVVDPTDPADPTDPTDPESGSLGSLTGGSAGGSLGSLVGN